MTPRSPDQRAVGTAGNVARLDGGGAEPVMRPASPPREASWAASSERQQRQRLWVVSELYFPEQTSTGYFVTHIAESLADRYDVRAICSQPTYARRGLLAPRREVRKGVRIERCRSSRMDKDVLVFRLINITTFTSAVALSTLRNVRRGDFVLVVTNPPLLPYVVTVAARARGARVVLLVHDVYPEALVATGMARPDSRLVRTIAAANRWLYRAVERIVVLGRDMRALLAPKVARGGPAIVTIPNWGDTEHVRPLPGAGRDIRRALGLEDAFIVQFMGNMGRSHAIDALAAAAESLRHRDDIHFLFIGWGNGKSALETLVRREGLTNVTLLPSCPEAELPAYLNACDVGIIAFRPGMAGVSVPSRMYNVMAAGKPIIALADPASELAQVVREEHIGWVVDAAAADRLPDTILEARHHGGLAAMGTRARRAAEDKYSQGRIADAYRQLFDTLAGARAAAGGENEAVLGPSAAQPATGSR